MFFLSVFQLALHSGIRASEQLRAQVGPIGVSAYDHLAGQRKKGEPLCLKIKGGSPEDTRYWFDPCVSEAGLVDCVWDTLRHTAAARWVMEGVPLAAVALYLGHQSISMTMRYSHVQPKNDSRAVATTMSFY